MTSYHDEKYIENTKILRNILSELPVFAADYFRHLSNKETSINTQVSYAYDLKLFFRFLSNSAGFKNSNIRTLDVTALDLLNVSDLEEYISYISSYQNTNGKNTLNRDCGKARKVASLRSFYNFYYDKGYIKTNPAALMDTPALHKKEIIRMDKDEVATLLSYVRNNNATSGRQASYNEKTKYRDIAILITLLGTGLRVSELIGLNLEDIDFKNASLHIIRKGGDADKVYFGQEVEDALLDYLNLERESLKPSDKDKDALFISLKHNRLSVRSVEVMVKKYTKAAGIGSKITPHKCRSTFGTNLYNATGDIYMVADALHHSSVETTRKHYAAIEDTKKRAAAKAASSLFTD